MPRSAWKDLPRRLLTVTLGVPSIILLLRNPITSWLFFQGAHLLCLIEWRALIPPATDDSEETISNNSNNDNAAKKPPKENILQAFLTGIITEETANSSPLSKYMFYLFCFFYLRPSFLSG